MIKPMIAGPVGGWRDREGLPCHEIGPPERAPRLALVADIDGDGLNSMFVLTRLAAFLRDVAAGGRRGLRLLERVMIVPMVDVRRFPRRRRSGRQQADLVADRLLEMTRSAYYRVEVRTSGCALEELPQVWLYAPSDDERASACLFGLPAVIEQPAEDAGADPLVRAWRRTGGENFLIRAGQSGNLQTRHCETLFRALAVFLERIGVVGGLRLVEDEDDLHYFDGRQACEVCAEQSGLFTSRLEVGRWVQAGEELGQIHDSFTGALRTLVKAPATGLLAGLRRLPLLCEGDLAARILVPETAALRPGGGG